MRILENNGEIQQLKLEIKKNYIYKQWVTRLIY